MKIGIDIRLIGKKRTGDEVVIFNLVKNIAQLNVQDEFILFTDVREKKILSEIAAQLQITNKENFKIISLPTANRFAWNFWTLARYLRKHPVDIYHTQYITPWFVPKNIQIVTIVHDISFNFFPQFIKFKDLFFLKTLIPISLQRADKVVGVSQFTRSELIAYYKLDAAKVEWIHNAISDDFVAETFTAQQLQQVREKYNLPKKFILYIGTLQPRKNIPHLIEAFTRIKDNIGEVKLVICGNRNAYNYDKKIDQTLEKFPIAGDVIFPGFIDEEDKAKLFHLAHVFVFPSLYEGFGIPVLEAMSQEVPVLCSNIPSLKEIAGSSAQFFDVNSMNDFSQKLEDICNNAQLRQDLIAAGKANIKHFSWENSARKLLAIYQDLRHN